MRDRAGPSRPAAATTAIQHGTASITHFLDRIGVPIVRGRGITEQDTATSPQVAIVNQTFAQEILSQPGSHRAKRFGIDRPEYSGAFEIVGVFRDFKMNLQYPREQFIPCFCARSRSNSRATKTRE